ncbi:MAG TPA: hypothetical protein VGJ70_12965 [Solirubrobacteraceae bacterium]|jgi:hypothetical protein
MSDDWRVELDIEGHGGPRRLLDAARERTVAREARHRLGERVLVSVDRDRLFGYAATREQAEEAARELGDLAAAHGLTAHATVTRWHPVEERWESPDVPLPSTAGEVDAERERLDAGEAAESRNWGYAEWEVRIELAKHGDAVALAERLEAEGLGVLRRSRYVLVGAATEDEAKGLADRLRAELPAGTKVIAEGSEAYAWAELHRYSWLGGLGQ